MDPRVNKPQTFSLEQVRAAFTCIVPELVNLNHPDNITYYGNNHPGAALGVHGYSQDGRSFGSDRDVRFSSINNCALQVDTNISSRLAGSVMNRSFCEEFSTALFRRLNDGNYHVKALEDPDQGPQSFEELSNPHNSKKYNDIATIFKRDLNGEDIPIGHLTIVPAGFVHLKFNIDLVSKENLVNGVTRAEAVRTALEIIAASLEAMHIVSKITPTPFKIEFDEGRLASDLREQKLNPTNTITGVTALTWEQALELHVLSIAIADLPSSEKAERLNEIITKVSTVCGRMLKIIEPKQ